MEHWTESAASAVTGGGVVGSDTTAAGAMCPQLGDLEDNATELLL